MQTPQAMDFWSHNLARTDPLQATATKLNQLFTVAASVHTLSTSEANAGEWHHGEWDPCDDFLITFLRFCNAFAGLLNFKLLRPQQVSSSMVVSVSLKGEILPPDMSNLYHFCKLTGRERVYDIPSIVCFSFFFFRDIRRYVSCVLRFLKFFAISSLSRLSNSCGNPSPHLSRQ